MGNAFTVLNYIFGEHLRFGNHYFQNHEEIKNRFGQEFCFTSFPVVFLYVLIKNLKKIYNASLKFTSWSKYIVMEIVYNVIIRSSLLVENLFCSLQSKKSQEKQFINKLKINITY